MKDKSFENEFDNSYNSFLEKLNIGLLTASFTAIMTILQRETIDGKLSNSLIGFAIALPITVIIGVAPKMFNELLPTDIRYFFNSKLELNVKKIFTYLALGLEIYSFQQLFLHFSVMLEIIFEIVAFVCLVMFVIVTVLKGKGMTNKIKIMYEQELEQMKEEMQRTINEKLQKEFTLNEKKKAVDKKKNSIK